jgi:hypothetical protein
LATAYKNKGLVVLAVNAWDEPEADVNAFVDQHKLTHRILLNGGNVARRYGVKGVPAVLWIDRTGTVVDAELDFHGPKSLERKTERLLAHDNRPGH